MKYPYVVGRILDHFPQMLPDDVLFRLRQSTFVSLPKRYMYFAVAKAGCTQMKELIRGVEGMPALKLFPKGDWQTRRDMFVHSRLNLPLPSVADLDDRTQKEVFEAPDFLRMTVVRNPYTRVVSAWMNKILLCEPALKEEYLEIKGRLPDLYEKSLISFPEFIEYLANKANLRTCNSHWRRQVDHTFFPAMNFSLVVKLEQLAEGLRRFGAHLGLSAPPVASRKNESLRLGSPAYTEELADKVFALYRTDFDVLHYDRSTWLAKGHDSAQASNHRTTISEEKVIDEIIERNLVMLNLYEECDRLQAQLQWVSKLHLQTAIKGLIALQSISRRGSRKIRRLRQGLFRSRREVAADLASDRQ
jgi:dermatan 4-sulfotransferase 1